MSSAYTDVVFSNSMPDVRTAMRLNKLRDDLSAALDSIGGYYSNAWTWTTLTSDAATEGKIGVNATSWALVTQVNVNNLADDGRDMTKSFNELFVSGNDLYLQDLGNSANNATYKLTGTGTNHGTWWSFPVSYTTSGGVLPANNASTDLTIYVKGASGGGATGDMLKSVYDTNNNGVVDTADSIAWTSVTGKPLTFPPDSTAMLKSVYDTNADSIVDHAALADTAPWTGVTGKPATFPPDATAMLKSVYDTNADNIVDHAALADTAPWTGLTGRPATFPPASHGSTHLGTGSDPVPVVTASAAGLAPTLNGNAATYLNGTGTYTAVSGSVNPGAWTSVTPGTGWTIPSQAQYRIEVNGAVSTVYFRGMIQAAYSALGTAAFTVPVGAQPSIGRSTLLAGAQNTGTPSDVASYVASMSAGGVCTIFLLGAGPFCWFDPSQTQQVYLDSFSYSL